MFRRKCTSVPLASLMLAIATALAVAKQGGKTKTHSVRRSKAADGAVDAARTGPKGGTATVNRSNMVPAASPMPR